MENLYYITPTYYSFSKIVFQVSNLTNILTKENLSLSDNGTILSSFEYTLKDNHPIYTIIPKNEFIQNHTISFFITINSLSSNIVTIYYSLITSTEEKTTYSLLKCKLPKESNISLYNLLITSINNQAISSNILSVPIASSVDMATSSIAPINETPTSYTLQVELKTSSNTSLPNGSYTLKTFVD